MAFFGREASCCFNMLQYKANLLMEIQYRGKTNRTLVFVDPPVKLTWLAMENPPILCRT